MPSTDRKSHEPRGLARLEPQHDRRFAVTARIADAVVDLGGARYRFASDLQDHVAQLDPLIGRNAGRIDVGHHDTLPARARNALGRSEPEPEIDAPNGCVGGAIRWAAATGGFPLVGRSSGAGPTIRGSRCLPL